MIIQGDCIEIMKSMPDNSIDSIVTDPPYEIGFMGKAWDNTGIAYNVDMWKECLRVLKPGGHLMAFGGTRTYHRMTVAIEDAGFEIRDMIEWVYGSGFPKSLNIGKAVDALQGNERTVFGEKDNKGRASGVHGGGQNTSTKTDIITKGTSEWEGYGTALKPAHEPICLARKPIEKGLTVAENCLKWGTGGLDIDGCRVETGDNLNGGAYSAGDAEHMWSKNSGGGGFQRQKGQYQQPTGRFPANFIHDNSDEVRECFPDAKGASSQNNHSNGKIYRGQSLLESETKLEGHRDWYNDSGNASRFFKSILYQAKASKSERTANSTIENNHPTVKPVVLMEYLVKMITRGGQTVLDPFCGSGSTGVACNNLGVKFIGIEQDESNIKIAKARTEQFGQLKIV